MPVLNCTLFMKTNFPGLALAILLSASLCAVTTLPAAEASFAFPEIDHGVGVAGELYYSPAHPSLALGKADPVEGYPHVNASLAGDLCGIDGEPVSGGRVLRRSRPLSVELAQRNEEGERRVFRASLASLLALVAPFLLMGRQRAS